MAISFIYIGLVQHIIALWSELTNLAKLDMFPIQTFLELKRRQVPISRIPQPLILVYRPHSMNGRYLKPPSQLFPCSESDFSFRGVLVYLTHLASYTWCLPVHTGVYRSGYRRVSQ